MGGHRRSRRGEGVQQPGHGPADRLADDFGGVRSGLLQSTMVGYNLLVRSKVKKSAVERSSRRDRTFAGQLTVRVRDAKCYR
jgi:hypothetical protein